MCTDFQRERCWKDKRINDHTSSGLGSHPRSASTGKQIDKGMGLDRSSHNSASGRAGLHVPVLKRRTLKDAQRSGSESATSRQYLHIWHRSSGAVLGLASMKPSGRHMRKMDCRISRGRRRMWERRPFW